MRILTAAAAALCLTSARPCAAQTPVSRDDAVRAALARSTEALLAGSDAALARAQRVAAHALPNPDLAASYSKDTPSNHLLLALPLDAPWLRGPRVAAADAAGAAAAYRYDFARAAVRFDAEAAYLRAQAAAAHARLSAHTARDADSLLVLTRLRRDAGDASDLDVELASVNAGELVNTALDDSLAAVGAVLDLQALMGLSGDSVTIALTDSLARPAGAPPGATGGPDTAATLPTLSAAAALRSAQQTLRLERASVLPAPTLNLGFDQSDPVEHGLLPTFGIGVEIPLFNRNRGPIAQALADQDRADAELAAARRESAAGIARARRERAAALAKVDRDARLLASADRVAALALVAYREGAAALPSVLEAERSARDAVGRYVDDLAAAGTADAELRYLTTPGPTP